MLTLGMFQLTHPEVLSEAELREILENSCIDFSNYKHLSQSELIELYKRVAMPLPRRQYGNTENSDTNRNSEERCSVNKCQTNSVSLSTNNTSKDTSEPPCATKSKSSENELKYTSKKVHLYNSNNIKHSLEKRNNEEKHDETPLRKRQKITWP
ncbi:uncharacterized protein LOC143144611 [Ptiloglossa arizonensis]|uniref:uncharacterized protein LOC143144611 n=1 Tax=Ptiloglossa arizonensis TaxID=3350558 RepID=UPI003FA0EEFB